MIGSRGRGRLIDKSELGVGQPLPGDLRDEQGRILICAGQVLTSKHLRLLGTRVFGRLYGGPDWDTEDICRTVSGDQLAEELFERESTDSPSPNQRAHTRHHWRVPLTLVISERGEFGVQLREIDVTAVDISRGGFAFNYCQYVAVGTHVRAQFDSLPSRPRIEGMVRSCRLIGGKDHRTGVQFILPKELSEADEPDSLS